MKNTGFAAEMEELDHAMQRAFVVRDERFLRAERPQRPATMRAP